MSRNRRLQARAVLFALVTALLAVTLPRCGKAPDPTPASGTFGSVYAAMTSNNCQVCHVPGGNNNSSTFDLTSKTTAYSTLVGPKVTGSVSKGTCGTVKLVVASSPSTSYLAGILFSTYNTANFGGASGCTTFYTGHTSISQPLTTDQQTSLIAWIQNGALNN